MLTEGVKLFVPILTTLGYDGDDKLPIKPMSFDSMRTTMSSHRGHLTRFVRVIGGWGVKILLYERKGRQVMFDDCMYVVTHKNELGDTFKVFKDVTVLTTVNILLFGSQKIGIWLLQEFIRSEFLCY